MGDSLKIGFVPLADAAPVIMAKEQGFFQQYGLEVDLVKVPSWARMRELLSIGQLQAGHVLAPMVIASAMGLEPGTPPLETSLSLNLNGNAITVSNRLFAQMHEADRTAMMSRPIRAKALKLIVQARRLSGRKPLTFAMVYPFSSHNYQLRYWLAEAGTHPDRDIKLIVVPPPMVMDYMESGVIDGYCVGEPWNFEAIKAHVGVTLITSRELMGLAPEKVLGVTQAWASANPEIHERVVSAILKSSQWLETNEAYEETSSILSSVEYIDVPPDGIMAALSGLNRTTAGGITEDIRDFNVFHRYAANFPWRSHAAWFVCQMIRWGQCGRDTDIRAVAEQSYRSDKYRQIARKLGIDTPTQDWKIEGKHSRPWFVESADQNIIIESDQVIDKRTFNPANMTAYLEGYSVHQMKLAITK